MANLMNHIVNLNSKLHKIERDIRNAYSHYMGSHIINKLKVERLAIKQEIDKVQSNVENV